MILASFYKLSEDTDWFSHLSRYLFIVSRQFAKCPLFTDNVPLCFLSILQWPDRNSCTWAYDVQDRHFKNTQPGVIVNQHMSTMWPKESKKTKNKKTIRRQNGK